MSKIIELADAIVADLEGETFSLSPSVARLYRPEFESAELETLTIAVVPRGIVIQAGQRKANFHDYAVDIAVFKKLDDEELADIDPLMGFVEEVTDFLRMHKPTGVPGVSWLKAANDPIYAPEHLQEMRQFTSLTTHTYRVLR